MRADQIIIVGGTKDGEREVSEPLAANDAIRRFYSMRSNGYSQLTMTYATTGEDYDVGKFMSSGSDAKQ